MDALATALLAVSSALEDSTSLLDSLRGTMANEEGAIDAQVQDNRAAILRREGDGA